MAQYEADKIIQLLKFCSWKAQTDMTHTGLHDLNSKLVSLPDDSEQTPNEKYLVDLYSDARVAFKKDNIITKRKSYIDLLLNFAKFTSWSNWKDHLYHPIDYIHKDNLTPFTIQNLKVKIWNPIVMDTRLIKSIEFVCESTFPKSRIIKCQENSTSTCIEHLLSQVEEHTFIIALFPIEWKNIPSDLKDKEWKELLSSGKIIPVWIEPNDVWETTLPLIPGLRPNSVISGLPGILTTLLSLERMVLDGNAELLDEDTTKTTSTGNSQHFHNPSGGIYLQGDIHNLHNGNGSQIINNYLD